MASYLSYNSQTQQSWRKDNTFFSRTIEEYVEDDTEENIYDGQFRTGENSTYFFGSVEYNGDATGSPNFKNELLCSASWSKDYMALQDLLKTEGSSLTVNAPDARSYTALHYSCSNGDNDITSTLLESGSHANIQDKYGFTALMHACLQNNLDVVASLVEHGADVNIQNNDGDSALHLACNAGYEEIVDFLLDHGANINQCNLEGFTALHMATMRGYVSLARLLLDRGAHANVADEEGDTPAHWAVRETEPEILKLLVQSGANIDLPNDDGETPLALAMELGERAMSDFLTRAAKKDFNNLSFDDTTPQFELDFLHS